MLTVAHTNSKRRAGHTASRHDAFDPVYYTIDGLRPLRPAYGQAFACDDQGEAVRWPNGEPVPPPEMR
jgi:hypothetical protein